MPYSEGAVSDITVPLVAKGVMNVNLPLLIVSIIRSVERLENSTSKWFWTKLEEGIG
jgi:hypothetical protein